MEILHHKHARLFLFVYSIQIVMVLFLLNMLNSENTAEMYQALYLKLLI